MRERDETARHKSEKHPGLAVQRLGGEGRKTADKVKERERNRAGR